jgi:hypothetical protein
MSPPPIEKTIPIIKNHIATPIAALKKIKNKLIFILYLLRLDS